MILTDTVETRAAQTLPRSLYAEEDGPWARTALTGRAEADVAIVGAGILGLSTALALAEAGTSVIVLEANEPGWGASGRNGGHANPGLKTHPDEVLRDFGQETLTWAYGAPTTLAALIDRLGIDAEFRQGGTYRAAVSEAGLRDVEALTEALIRHGIPARFEDAAAMEAATGCTRYHGAMLDPVGAQVNPLKYTRGLARAAQAAGAVICCDSPVTRYAREGAGWTVATPGGSVTAGQLLIATNGYSGPLVPKLAQSLIPVFSAIAASNPLPEALRGQILAGGGVLYETGTVTIYYRVDAAGRLIFGGRGQMEEADGLPSVAVLRQLAERTWPGLAAVGWCYGWNGRVAITADHYPHLHALEDSGLVAVGFNGRGVALTTALGPRLAEHLRGTPGALPFPVTAIRPIPFQKFWPVGVNAVLGADSLLRRLRG
ncbi:NAD(P)/FAD-dependent oxidoreductase [Pseudooceanicola nanhaiensis]|uniref:NAD(P)/FAD-dependent oxidoreductase n=1 Tax=Pseudooceanicola nanhaiensis TaxID=375761 RepID=UPI001CD7F436|nr:FAD-dependent oxidoreductase [Pseudooceanicola nanhaiensis]MCA0921193.1 FAD-binding oxidoreductase [Pseudooceanicola nanhaiensis]